MKSTNDLDLDSRQKMLQINVRQKDFYESWFEAMEANRIGAVRGIHSFTNVWSLIRQKIKAMRISLGVDECLYGLHRTWMDDLEEARVLDLGCFTGNTLSLWIAEKCADYIAIDLSERAITVLNAKLRERQLTHAHAYAQDFLANSYPDNHFDLVYAFSVLHHFKDISVMLDELYRVLKPGGIVIATDPLTTEPFNRLARMLYRPFQADRDWEWPFTHATFLLLQKNFEVVDMQGFLGMTKLGFPFQLVPGLGSLGQVIGRWGLQFDRKYARQPGLPFSLCWLTTLRLRKPALKSGASSEH